MANWFEQEFERETPFTVAELASDVVYRVPNCPDVTVRRALSNAYGEFCRRSSCLRHHNVYDMEPGRTDYPVVTWLKGRCDSVQRVLVDDEPLRENADYLVIDDDVTIVRLFRVQTAFHGLAPKLRIGFVEMPRHGSENATRWFLDRYGAAIVAGALAEIYAMQNMPWYRPEVAIAEGRKFQDMIGDAKMRGVSGANAGSGRVFAPDMSSLVI